MPTCVCVCVLRYSPVLVLLSDAHILQSVALLLRKHTGRHKNHCCALGLALEHVPAQSCIQTHTCTPYGLWLIQHTVVTIHACASYMHVPDMHVPLILILRYSAKDSCLASVRWSHQDPVATLCSYLVDSALLVGAQLNLLSCERGWLYLEQLPVHKTIVKQATHAAKYSHADSQTGATAVCSMQWLMVYIRNNLDAHVEVCTCAGESAGATGCLCVCFVYAHLTRAKKMPPAVLRRRVSEPSGVLSVAQVASSPALTSSSASCRTCRCTTTFICMRARRHNLPAEECRQNHSVMRVPSRGYVVYAPPAAQAVTAMLWQLYCGGCVAPQR